MFKVHQFEPRVLRWWWMQRSKIDMSPAYQRRGRLWSVTDKGFLIDSILNDYDIPKIYLADFTFGESSLNQRKLPYAIIDGKQRMEAIFEFFDGNLVLNDDFVYYSNTQLRLGGLGYPDLRNNHPDIADTFDNYHLSVMRVITDDEEKINELFVRLNRSKPLTGAEIRNAMAGPVPKMIRLIVDHDFFKSCVAFTVTRAQDKNAAAKLLLFEYNNKPSETKRGSLDDFVSRSRKHKEKLELASRRVFDTIDRMTSIFLPGDPLLRSAGILPVYYWFIRERDTRDNVLIREFLADFDRIRRQNRDLVSNQHQSGQPDPELLQFDQYNRNTNDITSHLERIKILNKRFSEFATSRLMKR